MEDSNAEEGKVKNNVLQKHLKNSFVFLGGKSKINKIAFINS